MIDDSAPAPAGTTRGETLSPEAAAALARMRIVLVETSHAGNVGSVARAMKTMGLARLELVRPRYPDIIEHEEARALAAGADDVLAATRIHDELDAAIADCAWSLAMTVRGRDLGPPAIALADGAKRALEVARAGSPIAIVFGSERYGLSNQDVQRCQACCSIPTDAQFASLNLAMAVQIATYECRQAAADEATPMQRPNVAPLASEAEREQYFRHLEEALVAIDFLDPVHSTKLMARLRRLYARTSLEHDEINILRGICTAILKASQP